MIYKSIADRLRLRLNSSDYNIGSPLPGEKALAQENGITPITLGKRILRTETAGMTTTAILLYELD